MRYKAEKDFYTIVPVIFTLNTEKSKQSFSCISKRKFLSESYSFDTDGMYLESASAMEKLCWCIPGKQKKVIC